MGSVHTKLSSYSGFSLFGFSALAGIIVFIFFGPSGVRHKHGRHLEVRGLENMGQTCYVSAIIQSLASCAHFRHWLQQSNCQSPTERSMSHLFPLVSFLHRACLLVNRQDQGESKNFNPQVNILRILSSMNYRLARGREQDAFELFEHVMSALQEETAKMVEKNNVNDCSCITQNPVNEVPPSAEKTTVDSQLTTENTTLLGENSQLGGGDTDKEAVDSIIPVTPTNFKQNLNSFNTQHPHIAHRLGYHHSVKKGLLLNPFVGATASRLTCLTCFTKNKWIVEKNQGFSLHLPVQSSDELTIRDLFNNYLKTVIVHEVECQGCTAKNETPTKSSFSKITVIIRLPRSLCLQIQRSAWSTFGSHKRSDYVTFQELLDLSSIQKFKDTLKKSPKPQASNFQMDIQASLNVISGFNNVSSNHGSQYRLCAVISHSSSHGVAESGHFVTFRRGPVNTDLWFLTSDEDVHEVPLAAVLNSNAYMLFYELIDGDTSTTTLRRL